MYKDQTSFYLLADEEPPLRTCKSKSLISKIMFLAAVASHHSCDQTNSHFDRKIGIWAFVLQEAAKSSSKNRPAGTLESKPFNGMNR
jgi:hypothetical protein